MSAALSFAWFSANSSVLCVLHEPNSCSSFFSFPYISDMVVNARRVTSKCDKLVQVGDGKKVAFRHATRRGRDVAA